MKLEISLSKNEVRRILAAHFSNLFEGRGADFQTLPEDVNIDKYGEPYCTVSFRSTEEA